MCQPLHNTSNISSIVLLATALFAKCSMCDLLNIVTKYLLLLLVGDMYKILTDFGSYFY